MILVVVAAEVVEGVVVVEALTAITIVAVVECY